MISTSALVLELRCLFKVGMQTVQGGIHLPLYTRCCYDFVFFKRHKVGVSNSAAEEQIRSLSSHNHPVISTSELVLELRCFCKEGDLEKALDVLAVMEKHGFSPPEELHWSFLRAFSKQKQNALLPVRKVISYFTSQGSLFSTSLSDYLISTLGKFVGLKGVLTLFNALPQRSVFSWTSFISALIEYGGNWQALDAYKQMRIEGMQPNEFTIVSVLKACGSIPSLADGKVLHAEVSMRGFDANVFVGSTLVSMYGKCKSIVDADHVFHGLSEKNVVSWNVMLSAFVENGECDKAICLYDQMKQEGAEPNERTLVILLQACCILADKEAAVVGELIEFRSLKTSETLCADIRLKGFESNPFIANSLISMFGKCGNIKEAEKVFLGMPEWSVISFTAMLSAYSDHNEPGKALQLYSKMQYKQVASNEWTLAIALHSCSMLSEDQSKAITDERKYKSICLEIGRALHSDARRSETELNSCVGSALVNMYGKHGSIAEAESVFASLFNRDIILWNSMLSAHVEQKDAESALHLYMMMQKEVSPNERTFVFVFQACSLLADKEETVFIYGRSTKKVALEIGWALHVDAQKLGFISSLYVVSSLVNMYGNCGSILEAENVFGTLPGQDVVSWTAMLSAYAEHGLMQNALEIYHVMQKENVLLDDTTVVCLLQGCSETGSLEVCKQIHFDILATRHAPSLLLTTAFIHAYGHCSSIGDACAVFHELLLPDVVSWSALIAGYAREGNFAGSFQTYDAMKQTDIQPNEVTFLSLLSACGHAGLVEKGIEYFESMSTDFALTPKIDHFVTLVDLLARVGELARAEDMLLRTPMEPDLTMWLCLLCACVKHGNLDLGKRVFNQAVRLHPTKAAAYLIMSNIYTDSGLFESAGQLELFMQKPEHMHSAGD